MHERYELDIALKDNGFKGEYVRDDKVWIVYTHFPILSDFDFTSSRVVLGVRYPFDVFDSFCNIGMTRSHNKTMTKEMYKKY